MKALVIMVSSEIVQGILFSKFKAFNAASRCGSPLQSCGFVDSCQKIKKVESFEKDSS